MMLVSVSFLVDEAAYEDDAAYYQIGANAERYAADVVLHLLDGLERDCDGYAIGGSQRVTDDYVAAWQGALTMIGGAPYQGTRLPDHCPSCGMRAGAHAPGCHLAPDFDEPEGPYAPAPYILPGRLAPLSDQVCGDCGRRLTFLEAQSCALDAVPSRCWRCLTVVLQAEAVAPDPPAELVWPSGRTARLTPTPLAGLEEAHDAGLPLRRALDAVYSGVACGMCKNALTLLDAAAGQRYCPYCARERRAIAGRLVGLEDGTASLVDPVTAAILECGHDYEERGERQRDIARIAVNTPSRGIGSASVLLETACAAADADGVTLHLEVAARTGARGLDDDALAVWYARHGFVREADDPRNQAGRRAWLVRRPRA